VRLRGFAVGVALVLATAACSGMESNRSVASEPGRFRLDEWSITADQPVLRPGRQTITATNLGHMTHELVIVKAADAASLPTKSDGSVDENQLDRVKVGEIADVPSGASHHKTFDLRPGSYVAFCNIVGSMGMGNGMMGGMEHVHFAAGMHTEFTVSA
jgi:plastocyanin